uniref:Uncharacterized protein n=1 Tax=Arundo donax TaxID=35708 RepID=A0A0A9AWR7_ARUDO
MLAYYKKISYMFLGLLANSWGLVGSALFLCPMDNHGKI